MILGGDDRQAPISLSLARRRRRCPATVPSLQWVTAMRSPSGETEIQSAALHAPRVALRLAGSRIDVRIRPSTLTAWSACRPARARTMDTPDRLPDLFPGLGVDDAEHLVVGGSREESGRSQPHAHRLVEPIGSSPLGGVHDGDALQTAGHPSQGRRPAERSAIDGALERVRPHHHPAGRDEPTPEAVPVEPHREMIGWLPLMVVSPCHRRSCRSSRPAPYRGPSSSSGRAAPSARSNTLIRPNRLPQ